MKARSMPYNFERRKFGLDLRDEQRMLHETLEEEKEADALLTKLAKGG
jgi:hypothetical protein